MRSLIVLLFLFSFKTFALSCRQYANVAEYLNTQKFVKASREYRALGREPELNLADINQARSVAFRFPAFEELGFGKPGGSNWVPYQGRLSKSALNGKNIGWEVRNEKGHARLRLDWDPQKGAHYNIEIMERHNGRTETHKLAINFSCGPAPCTERQVVDMVDRMNR